MGELKGGRQGERRAGPQRAVGNTQTTLPLRRAPFLRPGPRILRTPGFPGSSGPTSASATTSFSSLPPSLTSSLWDSFIHNPDSASVHRGPAASHPPPWEGQALAALLHLYLAEVGAGLGGTEATPGFEPSLSPSMGHWLLQLPPTFCASRALVYQGSCTSGTSSEPRPAFSWLILT